MSNDLIDQFMNTYSLSSNTEIKQLKQLLKDMCLRLDQIEEDLDEYDRHIRELKVELDHMSLNNNLHVSNTYGILPGPPF